ncbi:MAG: S-adenosylmethionine:tRNA ribosyltransferase-isomerase [Eubacteriales bacterium SKADARSKE-1]|nr:S-adenosylmethionine:tRNA ribosyltransferase-isomerase [Eubacteriales bacterium SKADARSKE-1]
MNKKDFYYDLPPELIAQTPIEKRDNSRLLVLDKDTGKISHKHFYDIIDELMPNDCLILNDSRVLPARIYGTREDTGAVVEFLLLNKRAENIWETIAGPGKKAKEGTTFVFGDGLLKGKVLEVLPDGNRIIEFSYTGNFYNILDKIGSMPLPHYITKKLADKERYQTVYSKELGSAAAPTAGLHFTKELLAKAKEKGINIGFVTLHVGLGTFRPVKVDNILDHKMHSEHYEVSRETADLIKATKQNGGRVISVGTTSCRTLESMFKNEGEIKESSGWTDIFIYPGYKFNVIDALITNFHLPESTLIMLVSAFCGRETALNAYSEAIREKYRFFSFGDSMFIK